MKGTLRYKPIGKETDFVITETKTLPIITLRDELANSKTTFMKDGTVTGTPVIVDVIAFNEGRMTPFKTTRGVLVQKEGGVYLLPFDIVTEKIGGSDDSENNIVKETLTVAEEKIDKAIDSFEPKEVLGFTYKQLLVMAVLFIGINKLL